MGNKNSKKEQEIEEFEHQVSETRYSCSSPYNEASSAKLCTDIGKKRVVVLDTKKPLDGNLLMENKVIEKGPLMLSPVDFLEQNSSVWTPKTPHPEVFESESRLESLPMDLLARDAEHDDTKADRTLALYEQG